MNKVGRFKNAGAVGINSYHDDIGPLDSVVDDQRPSRSP